jgi:hypothetical protein
MIGQKAQIAHDFIPKAKCTPRMQAQFEGIYQASWLATKRLVHWL